MAILVVGTNQFPTGATLVLVGKPMLIKHDPYKKKQKGLFSVFTIKRETRGGYTQICGKTNNRVAQLI